MVKLTEQLLNKSAPLEVGGVTSLRYGRNNNYVDSKQMYWSVQKQNHLLYMWNDKIPVCEGSCSNVGYITRDHGNPFAMFHIIMYVLLCKHVYIYV